MAHDITALVHKGQNTVGIQLGNGWQSMPGHTPVARSVWHHNLNSFGVGVARLLLSIKTKGGKTIHVPTNTNWVGTRDGPIRRNDIYHGRPTCMLHVVSQAM